MRNDIQMFDTMIAARFVPEYNNQDKMHGRIDPKDPNKVPQHGISYVHGELHTWWCREGWQVAELRNGSYTNHRGRINVMREPFKGFRYNQGFLPNLETVLELFKQNDL